MLGQEDNPAQLRKEMERARQEAANGSAPAATELAGGAETDGNTEERKQKAAIHEPSQSFLHYMRIQ